MSHWVLSVLTERVSLNSPETEVELVPGIRVLAEEDDGAGKGVDLGGYVLLLHGSEDLVIHLRGGGGILDGHSGGGRGQNVGP